MKKLLLSAALALGGLAGYSQNDSISLSQKIDTYRPDYFRNHAGALLHAKKEHGLRYLVENSRNGENSQAWAFLPKHGLWMNLTNKKDSVNYIDKKLIDDALKLCDTLELYHSYSSKKDEASEVFKEDFSIYGEIMRYVPTPEDNYWIMSLTYENPKKSLSLGIASLEGVLTVTPDSLTIIAPSLNNDKLHYHDKLNRGASKITAYLAEYFKGVPVSEFKENSKNIEGIIRVDFLPYKKD
ncbi:MAG TPA: hypothetical protein VEC16_06360 [Alphaproteobacteria bacterium]|nr:hypothetical protein [Alphaproteobacteria bacterium]